MDAPVTVSVTFTSEQYARYEALLDTIRKRAGRGAIHASDHGTHAQYGLAVFHDLQPELGDVNTDVSVAGIARQPAQSREIDGDLLGARACRDIQSRQGGRSHHTVADEAVPDLERTDRQCQRVVEVVGCVRGRDGVVFGGESLAQGRDAGTGVVRMQQRAVRRNRPAAGRHVCDVARVRFT